MKTLISGLLCAGCLLIAGQGTGVAQNRSIRFETGSFSESLAQARQEGKMIFMDCHTSWCGPCKLLAQNVFTIDSVADFFNSRFVNVQMDMEKGEGKTLQEKYNISAYPTLLLLDGEGQEVYRSVGGCSAADLMSRFRGALNPENTITGMEQKFAEGERDPEFINRYWGALRKAREFEKLQQTTAVYFEGMKMKKICREPHWSLYNDFVDIDNPLHHLMIENIRQLKRLKGDRFVEDKLQKAYDNALMGRIPNVGHTAEQLKQYEEDIEKIGLQDTVKLFYLRAYLKMAKMKLAKDYDAYLDFMEKELKTFSKVERGRAVMSLIILADGGTPEQRERGNSVLLREATEIMKENGGQLPAYEQQLYGFIQFRLLGKQE